MGSSSDFDELARALEAEDVDAALERAEQKIQEQQHPNYAYTRHVYKRQRCRARPLDAAAAAAADEAAVREAEEELARATAALDSPEWQPQYAGPNPLEQQQQQEWEADEGEPDRSAEPAGQGHSADPGGSGTDAGGSGSEPDTDDELEQAAADLEETTTALQRGRDVL